MSISHVSQETGQCWFRGMRKGSEKQSQKSPIVKYTEGKRCVLILRLSNKKYEHQ